MGFQDTGRHLSGLSGPILALLLVLVMVAGGKHPSALLALVVVRAHLLLLLLLPAVPGGAVGRHVRRGALLVVCRALCRAVALVVSCVLAPRVLW